ncbi:MAG: (2Fe-2S)-binding protein [Xanthobacteraceae bacterium]|nr:(2Fe-2S)-binding protein [Xanthobacteraceae bacterium]QYK45671.1 MAG: (2Fe-2S)-binding protein [Xanthobacteraceae bacterium]
MRIEFRINGIDRSLQLSDNEMLANVLRDRLELKGTKIGCGNGECGACTVHVDGEAVCSCLYPAYRVAGRSVTTIEGLSTESNLSVVQDAFVRHGAVQCGFCTGGMIMSASALLATNSNPSEAEITHALAGNICRCTGYRQIIDAVLDASGQSKLNSERS